VLALQALLVVRGLWPHRAAGLQWCRDRLGIPGTLFVALVLVVTSAFPSRELLDYARELVLASAVRFVSLGSIAALLLSIPAGGRQALSAWVDGLLTRQDAGRRWPRLVLGAAAFATLASLAMVWLSYDRHPHVPDEVAYIMHARYFAEGALGTPVPPVPEAFDVYLWPCNAERCFSPVPPGWPAMLAVGEGLGVGWMVNPLLAGLAILLCYRLLLRLYDERTARLSVLLLAMSPWFLTVSMSWMTHPFSLVCALVAAICVVRMGQQESGRAASAVVGGAAIGLVALTRPLEGVIVAGVLGTAALCVRGVRLRIGPAVMLGLATAAVGVVVFPYNAAMTGDATRFPIMAYADEALGPGVNALGFGASRGIHWGGLDPFPGHGLRDVVVNSLLNGNAIDGEMFGWAFGSLLPIVLLVSLRRLQRNDFWAIGWVVAIVFAHAFYWYSGGPDFAARYWYLSIVPLVALGARGVLEVGRPADGPEQASLLTAGAVLLSLLAVVTVLPWRAVDKYHHYRGMQPGIREILASGDFRDSLLLVRGQQHPDYASALVYTALDPYGDEPIVAWDRSDRVREALRRAYPDRTAWLVAGPSITGAGYELAKQPLPPLEPEAANGPLSEK
jgi:hypothetical protein